MISKRLLLTCCLTPIMAISITGFAADAPDSLPAFDKAMVLQEHDRIYVDRPIAGDFAVMNVRVFAPDNNLLMNVRSFGEPVEFIVDSGLPDGEYMYEVESVFTTDNLTDRSAPKTEKPTITRNFGRFTIRNGEIIDGSYRDNPKSIKAPAARDDASLLDRMIEGTSKLAGIVLEFMVPSAHATDVTITDGSPQIFWDDSDDADGDEWRTEVWGNSFYDYRLLDYFGTNTHQVVDINGAPGVADTSDSLVIDSDGDMHFANGQMNFDRGNSQLSIGTSLTRGELTLADTNPDFDLYNITYDDSMGWDYEAGGIWMNGYFKTGAGAKTKMFRVRYNATANSLVVDDAGLVWLAAGGKIHVGAGTDPVGQFTISSAAQPRFEMNDTTTGERWRFTVAADKFAINQLINGGTEFQVFNNGDVLIGGALTQNSDQDAKQDIVPVDHNTVLERIAALPISEWSYKDTPDQRHIGPMAQDFYAAFGLGMNDKGISTLDSSGVALAGIQALKAENTALKSRLNALESQQVEIMATLATLRAQLSEQAPVMAKLKQ